VQLLATDWAIRHSNSSERDIIFLRTRAYRAWAPPTLLLSGGPCSFPGESISDSPFTTHRHLTWRLKMGRTIPPLHLCACNGMLGGDLYHHVHTVLKCTVPVLLKSNYLTTFLNRFPFRAPNLLLGNHLF
jgi:hypothetical protein